MGGGGGGGGGCALGAVAPSSPFISGGAPLILGSQNSAERKIVLVCN